MTVLTRNRMVTVALAVGVIAAMYRNDRTRELLTGESGGWFG